MLSDFAINSTLLPKCFCDTSVVLPWCPELRTVPKKLAVQYCQVSHHAVMSWRQVTWLMQSVHAYGPCTGGAVVAAVQLWRWPSVAGSRRSVVLSARCRPSPRSPRHAASARRRRRRLHGRRPGRRGPRAGVSHRRRPRDGRLAAEADWRAAVPPAAVPTSSSTPAVVRYPPRGGAVTAAEQTATVHRASLAGVNDWLFSHCSVIRYQSDRIVSNNTGHRLRSAS